jgi:hypothetical protein
VLRGWHTMVEVMSHQGRGHMEPEHYNNALTAETGRRGGLKRAERQSAEERSALARYAARSRWHPRETQAAREKAQEITYLIQQALKDGKRLPLI